MSRYILGTVFFGAVVLCSAAWQNSVALAADLPADAMRQLTSPVAGYRGEIANVEVEVLSDGANAEPPAAPATQRTYTWIGSTVVSVDPQGEWLPMYGSPKATGEAGK